VITILISWESIIRIWNPVSIRFNQAIFVAVVGLGVNLVCAWLLGVHHHAHHEHNNDHHHEHDQSHHTDHNLQSAYMHVLADALTSVLAIVGLLIARSYGWLWIDPVMGIVGAIIIGIWSWRLIRGAGAVLLDTVPDPNLVSSIRRRLERNGDQVGDLHLWRVGPSHAALIASIVSDNPHPPSIYKKRLEGIEGLSHVTVEVQEREILRAA